MPVTRDVVDIRICINQVSMLCGCEYGTQDKDTIGTLERSEDHTFRDLKKIHILRIVFIFRFKKQIDLDRIQFIIVNHKTGLIKFYPLKPQ